MNVLFTSQDIQTLQTFLFEAQKSQERFNNIAYGAIK